MGEAEFESKALVEAVQGALAEIPPPSEDVSIGTPGGRFQVRWDEGGSATALGQLAFFAEFLEVSGLFERWVARCPMAYTSPNAPAPRDVLGTWLLSILDGQRRYAHVAGLRGDAVAPQILGMKKIVSDESLRRALAHLAPTPSPRYPEAERLRREAQLARSAKWMDQALAESTREALSTDWILDCDVTVKPLYGHQDGVEISYNPTKPGRPSHAIHTYWIANLRQSVGVRSLIERQWSRQDWQSVGQGFDAVEAPLKLAGWRQARRVVVLRRAVRDCLIDKGKAKARSKRSPRQQSLHFAEPMMPVKLWEYAVLVTNTDYDLEAMGQLYRDRADCENGFDELKNQWSWYVRLAHPKSRREAITSRPLLLAGIARLTHHAGQARLLVTLTHASGDLIKAMTANVRKGLDSILATAPQLRSADRWPALVRYILARIFDANPPPTPWTGAQTREGCLGLTG